MLTQKVQYCKLSKTKGVAEQLSFFYFFGPWFLDAHNMNNFQANLKKFFISYPLAG